MPDTTTTTLALDRSLSARIFDKDGHLHVEQVHITKAGVSPYVGNEIPHWKDLGLDADKIYRLFRDPAELEKAVASLNNKPLLFGHNPVHATAHDHERTVGTVSNPRWNAPYIDADMACWSGPAINCIKDDSQKELSSAYHYVPVKEPGTYNGEPYDLRMKDISFNHVGLVPKGRVGSDCVVADSAETVLEHLTAAAEAAKQIVAAQDASDVTNGRAGPHTLVGATKGAIVMAKQSLTGAAAHTQGALATYLRPKLAQDAKVDLGPLLHGITAKNFVARKPALVLGVQNAVKGKLAQDEDVDDVGELVDDIADAVVEAVAESTGQSEEEVAAQAAAAAEKGDDKPAEDDADMAAFRAKIKAMGLTDELVEKICAEVDDMVSEDDMADADEVPPSATVTGDAKPAKNGKPAMDAKNFVSRVEAERMARDAARKAVEGKVDRPAMDAAIAAERKRGEDLQKARDAVEPWVGKLSIACDSAEQVYRKALETLNVSEGKTAHADALWPILKAQPKPGEAPRRADRSALAQDAAGKAQSFEEMFPNAGRLAS